MIKFTKCGDHIEVRFHVNHFSVEDSQIPSHVIDLIEYCIENNKDPKDFYHRWAEFEDRVLDNLPMFIVHLDHLRESNQRRHSALYEFRLFKSRHLQGPTKPVESR